MPLPAGARLGPYEIVAPLGAGGMGEVYRARDCRLDRSVAIKVLPPEVAANPEARQRFEREARAISSLAHPHICALHDVGREGEVDYLVMELVDGESLASRLERGPLPLGEALRCGAQIAAALDRAHRAGIVHRDLKPGNVMLTRHGAKLLDFGLARRHGVAVPAGSLSQGPTRLTSITAEGIILGTLSYMAPEQLEGRPIDARADLFAFGAMLFEMVAGARAFDGSTPASVISTILRDEPPKLSSRAPLAPPALDRLIEHCLAKDPEERWQSAHDLALELAAIADAPVAASQAPAEARRRADIWIAAMLALVGLVAGVGIAQLRRGPPASAAPSVRFTLPPPAGVRLVQAVESIPMAVSPDGTRLAFLAAAADGTRAIWLRPLGTLEARPLPGTEGASTLFWSHDGRDIAFVAAGHLQRIALAGGPPVTLCDVPSGVGLAGSWGRDAILFATVQGASIQRLTLGTDAATVVVAAAPRGRVQWPHFLPDGEHFVYLSFREGRGADLWLAGPGAAPRRVGPITSRVELVGTDVAVFARGGALIAQHLDLERAAFAGEPVAVAPAVLSFGATGAAAFATSPNGTVVLATDTDRHQLTWFDTAGKELGELGERAAALTVAISPDQRRALVDRMQADSDNYDLWSIDLDRGIETRLTSAPGTDAVGRWLPDGKGIVYSSSLGAPPNLIRRDLASGKETPLHPTNAFQIAVGVTPDGGQLLFERRTPETRGFELWQLPLGGGEPTRVLPAGATVVTAALADDGSLLAYVASPSGRPEAYLRPFAGGEALRVSRDGALVARFSKDAKTLYFIDEGSLYSVQIQSAPRLSVTAPSRRFSLPPLGWADFDVAADGRLLALVKVADGGEAPLTVITGWTPPAP